MCSSLKELDMGLAFLVFPDLTTALITYISPQASPERGKFALLMTQEAQHYLDVFFFQFSFFPYFFPLSLPSPFPFFSSSLFLPFILFPSLFAHQCHFYLDANDIESITLENIRSNQGHPLPSSLLSCFEFKNDFTSSKVK